MWWFGAKIGGGLSLGGVRVGVGVGCSWAAVRFGLGFVGRVEDDGMMGFVCI